VHAAIALVFFVVACSPTGRSTTPPRPVDPGRRHETLSRESASDAERRLFALINAERATAGLPALAWNDRLALSARERSIALSRASAASSAIPTETDDRVRRVKLATSVFVENVARAPTLDDAHRAWMANPRQRANILSAAVNQVGVGVTTGDHATFAAEIFVHLGPKIDPVRIARSLRDSLPATVKSDPELASIAQEFADGLAAGSSSDQEWASTKSRIAEVERRYVKLHHTITAVADVADVDTKALLGGFPADDVGVGVAQGTHPELGDGAVWVVVMSGEELHSFKN
jgi:uncharacterized protein YkwD